MKYYVSIFFLLLVSFNVLGEGFKPLKSEELISYFNNEKYDEIIKKVNLDNLDIINNAEEIYQIAEIYHSIINNIQEYDDDRFRILNYKWYKKAYKNGAIISAFRISEYYYIIEGEEETKKMVENALKKGFLKKENKYITKPNKGKLKGKWTGSFNQSLINLNFDKSKIYYDSEKCFLTIDLIQEDEPLIYREKKYYGENNSCNEYGYIMINKIEKKLMKFSWFPNLENEGFSTYITTLEHMEKYKNKIKSLNNEDYKQQKSKRYDEIYSLIKDDKDEFMRMMLTMGGDAKEYFGINNYISLKREVALLYSNENVDHHDYKKSFEIYDELIKNHNDENSKYQLVLLLVDKKVTSDVYLYAELLLDLADNAKIEWIKNSAKKAFKGIEDPHKMVKDWVEERKKGSGSFL